MTLPGIEAWPVSGPVRVTLGRDAPPADADPGSPIAREWARLAAANPRLFDGPILSVLSIDGAELLCRRDTYQRLAVQPRVATGVWLLAVTGIVTARGPDGREHVLLGRRARDTRIYGGRWELGPSGGVSPPPASVTTLEQPALFAHLADEIAEEAGLEVTEGRPVALVRDLHASSVDIAFRIDAGPLAGAQPANWEYEETRWVPLDELAAFDAAHAGEIIDASRALLRILGWVPGSTTTD